MLVLDRNLGQSLMIGDDIRVEVVQVNGHQVRLGVTAPQHIEVFRQEIYKRILRERRQAIDPHEAFEQVFTASESLASPETAGIPIYRRLRHPWTR